MPPLRIVREQETLPDGESAPRCMRSALLGAAVYHIAVAALLAAFPDAAFRAAGNGAAGYRALWQAFGLTSGVFGVGYAVAATNPSRHWLVILLGLMAKILGPLSIFRAAAGTADAGPAAWVIWGGDAAWCVPLALILRQLAGGAAMRRGAPPSNFDEALSQFRTQNGQSLYELSFRSPVFIVFLRHTGCVFCREALADLWKALPGIESNGARLCLVHMEPESRGLEVLGEYYLVDVPRISDPQHELYRAFGLARGSFAQVFGGRVLLRAARALLSGCRMGAPRGDILQMPGVFLIQEGRILRALRHASIADRPDYVALAEPTPSPRMIASF